MRIYITLPAIIKKNAKIKTQQSIRWGRDEKIFFPKLKTLSMVNIQYSIAWKNSKLLKVSNSKFAI